MPSLLLGCSLVLALAVCIIPQHAWESMKRGSVIEKACLPPSLHAGPTCMADDERRALQVLSQRRGVVKILHLVCRWVQVGGCHSVSAQCLELERRSSSNASCTESSLRRVEGLPSCQLPTCKPLCSCATRLLAGRRRRGLYSALPTCMVRDQYQAVRC